MVKFEAFDVETRGVERAYALQPYRALQGEAWLTSAAWAKPTATNSRPATQSILKPSVEVLRDWLVACARTDTTICCWNTPFEIGWLIALGLREEVYACRWLDGMLLWRHLTSAPQWLQWGPASYGLKAAVAEFFPAQAGYEQSIDFDTDTPEGLRLLREYNELDAAFTLRLCHIFWDRLTAHQRRSVLLEAACLPMVGEAMVQGLCIDRPAAEALADQLHEKAKLTMVKLLLKCRDNEVNDETLASPTKLRKLLFQTWGLPPVKWTPKGAESTDRDALSQLAPDDERAWLLNEYREAKNNRTKFAVGALQSLDYNADGRVRPTPKVFGTYTGRMSYSSKVGKGVEQRPTGIALHQWKRDPAFRALIDAPPGYTLMEFDFAGQEFRWMAVMSKDPTMLKLCAPGEDMHSYMGASIYGLMYPDLMRLVAAKDAEAKEKRQFGKVGNLSLQYRTSARTLVRVARVQYGLTMSEGQAYNIHKTYRRTYPAVQRYWAASIKDARLNGYAETIAGRRIYTGLGDSWANDNVWGLESTAINSPIQGSGADQKYLALAIARDYLPTVKGRFYYELHDGLFFIVPDRYAEKAVVEMKELLSNLPYKKAWGKDLPIHFPVDAKWGKSWGALEEYK